MKKLLIILAAFLLLPVAALAQWTMGAQSTYGQGATVTDHHYPSVAIMVSCVIANGTGTIVTSTDLYASAGESITVAGTLSYPGFAPTACDGTFTLLTATTFHYTFASAATVTWNVEVYYQSETVAVDATHYWRVISAGAPWGSPSSPITQQTSTDGVTWGAESIFLQDASTGCSGAAYSLIPYVVGAINGLRFLFYAPYCLATGSTGLHYTRETSPGTWTTPATFTTASSGVAWQFGAYNQLPFVMPQGGYGILLNGCPPGAGQAACLAVSGDDRSPNSLYIAVTYDNGVTWGNAGTPGPSLIVVGGLPAATALTNENGAGCFDAVTDAPCVSGTTSANLIVLARNEQAQVPTLCSAGYDICPVLLASATLQSGAVGSWTLATTNIGPNAPCLAHITPNISYSVGPGVITAPNNQATVHLYNRCRLNSAYYTAEEAVTFTPSSAIASPTSFPTPQVLFLSYLGWSGGNGNFTFKYGSTTQGWLSWVTNTSAYGGNIIFEQPLTYGYFSGLSGLSFTGMIFQ
jgi:hypothetical protein